MDTILFKEIKFEIFDLTRLCLPKRYAPSVSEHVPLHSKSICKKIVNA